MNKYKQKFLLWYVRWEIKKFSKRNKLKTHKARIAYLNRPNRVPEGNNFPTATKVEQERLEQLMKWEYSLKTHGHLGADLTSEKVSLRNFTSHYLEPSAKQWAKWLKESSETPLVNYSKKKAESSTKTWSKEIDGVTYYISDEKYQEMRKKDGLPPREHTYDPVKNAENDKIDLDIILNYDKNRTGR